MLIADLAVARGYLAHNPPPGQLLLCAVSGAHLYGSPSPDSDLDLKGVHLVPTTSLLGLNPSTPPHDHTEVFGGVECDLTTNEAADALRLVALTGIDLMRTGVLEANLPSVVEVRPFRAYVDDLIAMKRAGAEHAALDGRLLDLHRPILDRLAAELEEAASSTALPSEATNGDEIERWLVAPRRAEL